MTRCLTEVELQAVADNEADARLRAHAAECPVCRGRIEETRRALDAVGALLQRLPGPSVDLTQRVQQAMQMQTETRMRTPDTGRERGRGREGGATTMRPSVPADVAWRRRAWTSGLAAAALIVLAVFVIWPGVSRESHLSAAEILGRSLQTFSATSGVETFEYDVQIDGLATHALVPDTTAGALRITQVIDHDHPGRYRVTSVEAGKTPRSSLVQDPARGTRVGRFVIDDHTYFFRFTAPPERARSFISLPDLQRTNLRALVSVMQSTADQKLSTITDETGTYYAIQVPPMSSASAGDAGTGDSAMWNLSEAHALIHAGDFHLKELSARGSFLGQPFGLAFTLVRHESMPSAQLAADAFTLEPEPDDIQLEGPATDDPPGDVVLAALRALAKARR